MPSSVGFYSYSFAFFAYFFLSLLLLISWRGRALSTLLLTASLLSALWALVAAGAEILPPLKWGFIRLAELLKSGAWCLFIARVIDLKHSDSVGAPVRTWRFRTTAVFSALFVALFLVPILGNFLALPDWMRVDFALIVWIVTAIFGMLLVEQMFSNASTSERWGTKYICLGLGGIFAFDFFMFADALLFKQLNFALWSSRGLINALAVPLIAVSIARNPKWELGIHVSRHVVFHTVTLMGAGVYLLIMATAGYFIRYYGGNWGGVIQVVFLCGTGILLITLLFSDSIRAKTRVFLSKHFFSYKYDYREQWSNFTKTLSAGNNDVPEQIICAIAALVGSPAGVLWARSDAENFRFVSHWSMPQPEVEPGNSFSSMDAFCKKNQWVIDLEEYIQDPGLYRDLDIPNWVLSMDRAWLLVPLIFRAEVIGFVLFRYSEKRKELNWEDRDLLKIAGQQAAIHLAQYQANQALINARQFEAFNRLSAYVVHDLKNILAQQSLIVSNAQKHKHNPAFVDDVISTVSNSVQRMSRLMEQMRSGMRGSNRVDIGLSALLAEVVARASERNPRPRLHLNEKELTVHADKEELGTVFGHIIQNAQEATPPDGEVVITLENNGAQAIVVVSDTGSGMNTEFIRDRLFKPFDSTKGLTGMGVGAFESREFVRALGGDLRVKSTPGKGSTFTIVLPCTNLALEPGVVQ